MFGRDLPTTGTKFCSDLRQMGDPVQLGLSPIGTGIVRTNAKPKSSQLPSNIGHRCKNKKINGQKKLRETGPTLRFFKIR